VSLLLLFNPSTVPTPTGFIITPEQSVSVLHDNIYNSLNFGIDDELDIVVLKLLRYFPLVQLQHRNVIENDFKVFCAIAARIINFFQFLPDIKITDTIILNKLTPGGTDGQLVFIDGFCVSAIQPT
jgi:hypothetical protein